MGHQWEQNRWWWVCERCGAAVVSAYEPREDHGKLQIGLILNGQDPVDLDPIEFGPDCDLELVKEVMES
jgi:hypothetical protein